MPAVLPRWSRAPSGTLLQNSGFRYRKQYGYLAMPSLSATRTRSARESTPVFFMTCARGSLIFCSPVLRSKAICLLSCPATTCFMTTSCRGVKLASLAPILRFQRPPHAGSRQSEGRHAQPEPVRPRDSILDCAHSVQLPVITNCGPTALFLVNFTPRETRQSFSKPDD